MHRRERFGLQEVATWPQGISSGEAAGHRWLADLQRALRPHVSGFAYQNYIDPTLAGWQHAYYGQNYGCLRRIKRRVDPDNLFRFKQSVKPA